MKWFFVGIIITLFIFIGLFCKKKNWTRPDIIYAYIWMFFLLFFLIFDKGKSSYSGVLWILCSILVYYVGSKIGRISVKSKSTSNNTACICIFENKKHVKKAMFLFVSVLTIYCLYNYIISGGYKNAANVAYDYYTSTEQEKTLFQSITTQLFTISLYFVAFLGGLYYRLENQKKTRMLAYVTFLPSVIMMLTSSGKLGLILSLMLFCIGYLIACINSNASLSTRLLKKEVETNIWLIIGIFLLLIFSFIIRMGGSFTSEYINISANKMVNYAFGSSAAFNSWFSKYKFFENYGLGRNTFTGILRIFGAERLRGVYKDLLITSVWRTNVYTAFRGIIMDFGIIGGLLFIFFIGFIAGRAYKKYILNGSIGSFIILAMSYLFVLFSFLNSPFVYFNLSVLFIFIALMSFVYKKLIIQSNKSKNRISNKYSQACSSDIIKNNTNRS